MIGPALAQLFMQLDARRDKLTEFETDVHEELLRAMRAGSLSDNLHTHLSTKGLTSEDFSKLLGSRLSVDLGAFETRVDLGGGAGGGTMQTNCSRADCPNKVR